MSYPAWVYKLRNAPIHAFARLIFWLVRVLPRRAAFAMGRNMALMAWSVFPRWRRTARRNLEILFDHKLSDAEIRRIGRQSAINLGYMIIECILMTWLPVEEVLEMIVEVEGMENYDEAFARGKGAIGLAMHYGNWELTGVMMTNRVRQLHAVGKEQRDDFFTNIVFPMRERLGIINILSGYRANSAVLRALKANHILGLVADQNGGQSGLFADFAGIPASTVAGPAALALKFDVPLVVTYCRRLAPGKFKFVAKPILDASGLPEDKDDAVIELLGRINGAFAEVLRGDPAQWLLGHKRWKTRPEGEESLY